MQNLQLSAEEAEALKEVLHHLVADLEVEVFRTDTRDFKEILKHRRELFDQILEKLKSVPATA